MEANQLGEVVVTYKYNDTLKSRPTLQSSNDAQNMARKLIADGTIGVQEHFVILFLNNCNKLIGSHSGFKGTLGSVVVDLKIIAVTALKLLASKVIIVHNHPSGKLSPSSQDINLTDRLKNALCMLEIALLDHIILGPDGDHFSFSENNLLN